jgi:hypothetical protein
MTKANFLWRGYRVGIQGESKWHGQPLYDRPLGTQSEGTDDGRPVVWITDFSACTPQEHWSDAPEPGLWQVIDFATDAFEGNLLYAENTNPAPDVTLELNLSGWYAVYLWMMGADGGLPKDTPDYNCVYSQSPGPALKLTSDRRFHHMFRTLTQVYMKAPGLEGGFWRYADMTDQSLTIRHQDGTVYLAAIQAVPLAPAEVEAVMRDRNDPSRKRLIIKGDSYTEQECERTVELLRDRGVGGWIIGNENSPDLFHPGGSRRIAAFKRACQEIEAECYVCDRPTLWSGFESDPWDDARAKWYTEHPDFHCKEKDGTDNYCCSYAVPEVVDFMLDRVRASVSPGPDGFGYFFNRDPHGLVRFEPAAIAGFEEKHGVDPLTLSDRDERLIEWRMDIITRFLRRVRETLDSVAEENGFARIKMIHVVLGNEAANRYACLDVPRWVQEGLVDILCPYPFADCAEWWLAQGHIETDVAYFASLVKDTPCKLVPMWLSNRHRISWVREHVRTNEYFTKAIRDYAAGADGLTSWDQVGLDAVFNADRWLRLGDKERLAEWAEEDVPIPPFQRLTRLDGNTMKRFPAASGG